MRKSWGDRDPRHWDTPSDRDRDREKRDRDRERPPPLTWDRDRLERDRWERDRDHERDRGSGPVHPRDMYARDKRNDMYPSKDKSQSADYGLPPKRSRDYPSAPSGPPNSADREKYAYRNARNEIDPVPASRQGEGSSRPRTTAEPLVHSKSLPNRTNSDLSPSFSTHSDKSSSSSRSKESSISSANPDVKKPTGTDDLFPHLLADGNASDTSDKPKPNDNQAVSRSSNSIKSHARSNSSSPSVTGFPDLGGFSKSRHASSARSSIDATALPLGKKLHRASSLPESTSFEVSGSAEKSSGPLTSSSTTPVTISSVPSGVSATSSSIIPSTSLNSDTPPPPLHKPSLAEKLRNSITPLIPKALTKSSLLTKVPEKSNSTGSTESIQDKQEVVHDKKKDEPIKESSTDVSKHDVPIGSAQGIKQDSAKSEDTPTPTLITTVRPNSTDAEPPTNETDKKTDTIPMSPDETLDCSTALDEEKLDGKSHSGKKPFEDDAEASTESTVGSSTPESVTAVREPSKQLPIDDITPVQLSSPSAEKVEDDTLNLKSQVVSEEVVKHSPKVSEVFGEAKEDQMERKEAVEAIETSTLDTLQESAVLKSAPVPEEASVSTENTTKSEVPEETTQKIIQDEAVPDTSEIHTEQLANTPQALSTLPLVNSQIDKTPASNIISVDAPEPVKEDIEMTDDVQLQPPVLTKDEVMTNSDQDSKPILENVDKAEEPAKAPLISESPADEPFTSTIELEKPNLTSTDDLSEKVHSSTVIPELKSDMVPTAEKDDLPVLPLMFPLNRLEQAMYDIEQLPASELREDMKYVTSTPYKSLKDYPFYLKNKKVNDLRVCRVLLGQISENRKSLHKDSLMYRRSFHRIKAAWLRYCDSVGDNQGAKRALQDAKAVDTSSSSKDLHVSGSSTRRGRNHGDSVRSEAEFLEILANLERESARDPSVRAKLTSAHVPDLIFDPIERDEVRYIDTNNFVEDKSIPYQRLITDCINNFSPEEHEAFCEAYVLSPKQFGKIARAMGGRRTFNDCVLHYYQTKKQVDYKALLLNRNRRTTRKGRKKAQKEKERALALARTPSDSNISTLADEVPKSTAQSPSALPVEPESTSVNTLNPDDFTTKPSEENDRKRPSSDPDGLLDTRKRVKKPRGGGNTTGRNGRDRKRPEDFVGDTSVDLSDQASSITDGQEVSSPHPQQPKERAVSYWSVSETNLFQQVLLSYGTNWEKVAKHFKSKSVVMVKNYFAKHAEAKGWGKLAAETDEKINQGLPVPLPPSVADEPEIRKRGSHKNLVDVAEKQTQMQIQQQQQQFFVSSPASSTPVQRPITPSTTGHTDELRLTTPLIRQPQQQPAPASAEAALMNALDKKLSAYSNRPISPAHYQKQQQQGQQQPLPQLTPQARSTTASIQNLLQASEEKYTSPMSFASLSSNSRTLPAPPALSTSSSPQNQFKTLPKLAENPPTGYSTQPYSSLENKPTSVYSYNDRPIPSLSPSNSFESNIRPGYYLPKPNIPPLQPATTSSVYYMPHEQERQRALEAEEERKRSNERKLSLEMERIRERDRIRAREAEEMERHQQNLATASYSHTPVSSERGTYSSQATPSRAGVLPLSSITDMPANNTYKPPYSNITPVSSSRPTLPSRGSSISSILNPISSESKPPPMSQSSPILSVKPPERSPWYDSARQSSPSTTKQYSPIAPSNQVYLPSLQGLQQGAPSRSPYSSIYSEKGLSGSPGSMEPGHADSALSGSSSLLQSPYSQSPTGAAAQSTSPGLRSNYLPLPSLTSRTSYSPSQTSLPLPHSPYSNIHTAQQQQTSASSSYNLYQNHYRAPDQAIDKTPLPSSFLSNNRNPATSTTPTPTPAYGYEFPSRESNERGLPPPAPHQQQRR